MNCLPYVYQPALVTPEQVRCKARRFAFSCNPPPDRPLVNGAAAEPNGNPQLRMAASVARQIMNTVGARLPETGGILLGPVGSEEVTGFHFDTGGSRSSVTYSPDHVTLQRLMRDEWLPSGIDMKGFAHSHPGAYDRLSGEDLRYIHRLLVANDDMRFFAAPLVIPRQFRMRPFVVMRDDTSRAVEADLLLF